MIALARWLLRRMLPRDVRHDVLADLDAEFAGVRPVRSRAAAAAWYWRQVLGSLGPALAMRVRRAGRLARDAGQDARIGLRLLARNKTYTVAAVLTLALGIGATTAVFSVVDAVEDRHVHLDDVDAGAKRLGWLECGGACGRSRQHKGRPSEHAYARARHQGRTLNLARRGSR